MTVTDPGRPGTAEVIRSGVETVCFEMATYVSRTATTPILNQSNEAYTTIMDGQGRLAALSVGIPQFMLSATRCCERWPPASCTGPRPIGAWPPPPSTSCGASPPTGAGWSSGSWSRPGRPWGSAG